jgi:hypothetical protein
MRIGSRTALFGIGVARLLPETGARAQAVTPPPAWRAALPPTLVGGLVGALIPKKS